MIFKWLGERISIEVGSNLGLFWVTWFSLSFSAYGTGHTLIDTGHSSTILLRRWQATGSARRGDLYLTTHNIHRRQTTMPPAGFEPVIPASEWLHTHFLAARRLGSAAFPYYNTLFLSLGRQVFTFFYRPRRPLDLLFLGPRHSRWGGGSTPRPGRLYPQESPGTHCTGGWVGPQGRSGRAKISSPPGFDPGSSIP